MNNNYNTTTNSDNIPLQLFGQDEKLQPGYAKRNMKLLKDALSEITFLNIVTSIHWQVEDSIRKVDTLFEIEDNESIKEFLSKNAYLSEALCRIAVDLDVFFNGAKFKLIHHLEPFFSGESLSIKVLTELPYREGSRKLLSFLKKNDDIKQKCYNMFISIDIG
ncbi:MAG: hypothetical protein HC831_07920 [Chloroflexia bacterium]|nr:hypothetical protein [Chloroflexia bacterium]